MTSLFCGCPIVISKVSLKPCRASFPPQRVSSRSLETFQPLLKTIFFAYKRRLQTRSPQGRCLLQEHTLPDTLTLPAAVHHHPPPLSSPALTRAPHPQIPWMQFAQERQ